MTSSIEVSCETLLKQGHKIQAIKMWRQSKGTSLKEAKAIIEHFEVHGVWLLASELPPGVLAPSAPLDTTPVTAVMTLTELQSECANLISSGQRISAIKMWRQQTDSSLREAKEQIERFEATGSWSTPS